MSEIMLVYSSVLNLREAMWGIKPMEKQVRCITLIISSFSHTAICPETRKMIIRALVVLFF